MRALALLPSDSRKIEISYLTGRLIDVSDSSNEDSVDDGFILTRSAFHHDNMTLYTFADEPKTKSITTTKNQTRERRKQ